MTCTIHHFAAYRPASPAEQARINAIAAARAILRSKAPHTDDTLAEACAVIKALADPFDQDERADVLTADAMLVAIRKRARDRAQVANHRRGTIRMALLDFAGLLLTFAAVVMVFLVGAE